MGTSADTGLAKLAKNVGGPIVVRITIWEKVARSAIALIVTGVVLNGPELDHFIFIPVAVFRNGTVTGEYSGSENHAPWTLAGNRYLAGAVGECLGALGICEKGIRRNYIIVERGTLEVGRTAVGQDTTFSLARRISIGG